MANDRLYTVTPYDFDGEAFTIEGLQPALDKARELWGGKEHKANSASPAMTLGGGRAFIQLESGCATLLRDDAARDLARRRSEEDQIDGRMKTYYATVTIGRIVGTANMAAEEVETRLIEGEGLMGLLFNSAMFVQDVLGDVPECLSYEACERRERSLRAQISRARGQERDVTGFHFPSSDIAGFFELGTRPGEYYRVVIGCHVNGAPENTAAVEFPELPRRS